MTHTTEPVVNKIGLFFFFLIKNFRGTGEGGNVLITYTIQVNQLRKTGWPALVWSEKSTNAPMNST